MNRKALTILIALSLGNALWAQDKKAEKCDVNNPPGAFK